MLDIKCLEDQLKVQNLTAISIFMFAIVEAYKYLLKFITQTNWLKFNTVTD